MNELVSIIVPVYNMEDSIESCVNSVLEQDYENLEILLIDDGSTDGSFRKCQVLAARDKRVSVIHTENRGAGPARNLGMERAGGRYVYFPDADDKLTEHAIFSMAAAMDGGVELVLAGYRSLNASGKLIQEKRYPDEIYSGQELREHYERFVGIHMPCGVNGAPWNKLYDLRLIKRYGIEFPPLRRHQDSAFLLRYLCHVTRVHFIQDIVYIHYLNDLKKEWYKYPAGYIDSVTGLFQVQMETVLAWNPDNHKVKNIFLRNYISAVIKSMELSWSPRVRYRTRQRIALIQNILDKAGLREIELPDNQDCYHRMVFDLLRRERYRRALLLMRFKVFLEENGIVEQLKLRRK